MAFDFASNLSTTEETIIIDPEEIFRKLASGKNLWIGQGDILRDWYRHREKKDILIAMDTGMGKTIVGLLIAYSLMYEKKKKVIYVCASKQLVEQTINEAAELGIKTASYISRTYTNEFEWDECKVPLVTTYQALFNGKSVFSNEDIGGIVFDDSHVAGNILKDSFTLSIPNNHPLYTSISHLFKSYFESVGQDVRYKNILEKKGEEVLILPPFEVKNHLAVIKKLFVDAKVDEDVSFLFSWEYLKDNLDMCLFLINQNRIEITPPVVPAKTLSYFQENVSRIYLSATHVGMDYFPRYYGNKIKHFISFPSGKSKSKKFIISPHKTNIKLAETKELRKLIFKSFPDYRSLIITPSFKKAKLWKEIGGEEVIESKSDNILESIKEFKKSDNKKLILANRYDGIDFPGKTCRILVFDGLPNEGALLNSYFSNQLKATNYMRTEMNAKILQGIGRIFRGTDDYGIVILLGKQEVKWISTPKNMMDFPELMQIQLKVGDRLNSMINEDNISDLIRQILNKDTSLMESYDRFIEDETKKFGATGSEEGEDEKALMEKVSILESHIYSKLWKRDISSIEGLCNDLIEESRKLDVTINAWHYFICAIALQISNEEAESTKYYLNAHRLSDVLPKLLIKSARKFSESKYGLANSIIDSIENFDKSTQIKNLQKDFDYLDSIKYSRQDKKHELSIELLGKYLGFKTERPDNDCGTGPDVLWELPNGQYVILELKTNKTTGGYTKKETSQSLDHVEWVKKEKSITKDSDLCKIIVGPHNEVNGDANPSNDTWVIELEEFQKYAKNIISALESCYSSSFIETKQIEELLNEQKLFWEDYFENVNKKLAIDLKV